MTSIKSLKLLGAVTLYFSMVIRAECDTFGSGANSFDIEFVAIGNRGNAGDTTGIPYQAGSVSYPYRIGKFEISEQMIDKANAAGGLGITKDTRGPDKPATSVSWNAATRFINWLNTTSGSVPAYKFAIQPGEVGYSANADIQLWSPSDAGYNRDNRFRNSLARYFLPSIDEWYKAAYYDPTSGVYYDYPTGSNIAPTAVASGTAAGTAVHMGQSGPADIMLAGGLSPYGTMAQGGNVRELLETTTDGENDTVSYPRYVRGGDWLQSATYMRPVISGSFNPRFDWDTFGFRVASTPEPSSLFLVMMAGLGFLGPRHRRTN